MKSPVYLYGIFRLNKKYWTTINDDLKSRGYKNIRVFIPTIQILKKVKSGKKYYEEVPLLFNYGFIRMRSDKIYDRPFLMKLSKSIPGILGWLRSLETMHPRKKKKRIDNVMDWDDFSKIAIVPRKLIRYYKKLSKNNDVHSLNDIVKLKIGDYIELKGYPFEGLGAIVKEVNLNTQMVTIEISTGRNSIVLQLSMDQVLYSIYNDYDEDKLTCYQGELDLSNISENITDYMVDFKKF